MFWPLKAFKMTLKVVLELVLVVLEVVLVVLEVVLVVLDDEKDAKTRKRRRDEKDAEG